MTRLGEKMSRWWVLRSVWLALGLLTGVIAFLPESAATLTGGIVLVFIAATLVLLGRWAVMVLSEKIRAAMATPDPNKVTLVSKELLPGASFEFEAQKVGSKPPRASESETVLSRFRLGGYQFKAFLNTEEENLEPRKEALMWDSVLFAGGIIGCAALLSLMN